MGTSPPLLDLCEKHALFRTLNGGTPGLAGLHACLLFRENPCPGLEAPGVGFQVAPTSLGRLPQDEHPPKISGRFTCLALTSAYGNLYVTISNQKSMDVNEFWALAWL